MMTGFKYTKVAYSNTTSRAPFTKSRIMPALCGFENAVLVVLYVLNICVNNSFWGLSQEFIIKTMAIGMFYDRGSLSVCVWLY